MKAGLHHYFLNWTSHWTCEEGSRFNGSTIWYLFKGYWIWLV